MATSKSLLHSSDKPRIGYVGNYNKRAGQRPGSLEVTDLDRWKCLVCRVACCGVVTTLTVGNAILCSLPLFFDHGDPDPAAPTAPPPSIENLSITNSSANSTSDMWLDAGFGIFLPIVLKFSDEDMEALGMMWRISVVQAVLVLVGFFICRRGRARALASCNRPTQNEPPAAPPKRRRKRVHELRQEQLTVAEPELDAPQGETQSGTEAEAVPADGTGIETATMQSAVA